MRRPETLNEAKALARVIAVELREIRIKLNEKTTDQEWCELRTRIDLLNSESVGLKVRWGVEVEP